MPERQDVLRPADDAARAQAKRLIRTARFGALATEIDGAPVLLASDLSAHTEALKADPRCSLLAGEPGKGDPLAHPRVTLFAVAERLPRDEDADARRRFLARHPKAALYADFGDFAFWRLRPERADFNGGFGKACVLEPADLAPRADWRALAEAEAAAVAHMNADHADAVDHFARICGASGDGWTLTGLDPEGCDLARGDEVRRLEFMTPVRDAGGLRAALVALARREA